MHPVGGHGALVVVAINIFKKQIIKEIQHFIS
jgi:hypothetical protein